MSRWETGLGGDRAPDPWAHMDLIRGDHARDELRLRMVTPVKDEDKSREDDDASIGSVTDGRRSS